VQADIQKTGIYRITYIHTCTRTHIYTYIPSGIQATRGTYAYTHIYIYRDAHIYIYNYTYMHIHAHICIHAHIHAHMYTHIHTCIYT